MSERPPADEQTADGPVPDVEDIEKPDVPAYGADDSQSYVDRDAIDFDPEEGLYSGTAVHGGESEIPDPPSDEAVQAAFEDIKSGGTGIIDENRDRTQPKDDSGD